MLAFFASPPRIVQGIVMSTSVCCLSVWRLLTTRKSHGQNLNTEFSVQSINQSLFINRVTECKPTIHKIMYIAFNQEIRA